MSVYLNKRVSQKVSNICDFTLLHNSDFTFRIKSLPYEQDRDVIYNCSSNRLYFPYYNSLSNMVTSFITALLLPGVNRQCRRWPSTSPWFFRSDRDSSGDAQTFRPEQFRWRHSQASLSLEPFHRRHRVSRRWLGSLGRPTHNRSVCGRKRFSPEIVWLSESML